MAELRVLICKNCVESNQQRDFYMKKSRNLERKLEDHTREVGVYYI